MNKDELEYNILITISKLVFLPLIIAVGILSILELFINKIRKG